VAAVRWGTRPDQTTVRTTVAGLGAAPIESPATIVIGAVAAIDLAWFEARPLFGKRVVVTRAREQASTLAHELRTLGAETVELPAIRIKDAADGGAALRRAAATVGDAAWLVFTSANAVGRFVPLLRDSRDLAGVSIAAIGPGTADALAQFNLVADLVPERFVAESLLDAFPAGSGHVVLPRAAVARDVLPDGLRAKGWEVDVVEAYRTVAADVAPEVVAAARAADAVTFTSSSTVTRYLEVAGPDAVAPVVVCIGPVTAQTARDHGLQVDAVADEHSVPGLVDAVVRLLANS
jgi:uroporphyrinogen III methyltransferase/synthase